METIKKISKMRVVLPVRRGELNENATKIANFSNFSNGEEPSIEGEEERPSLKLKLSLKPSKNKKFNFNW
jgi:hypothetical protein